MQKQIVKEISGRLIYTAEDQFENEVKQSYI
jgi:hypothetical protein